MISFFFSLVALILGYILYSRVAERVGLKQPLFPALFVTIACGAVSGFHATQSPMMARCMKSERQGRHTFYGAMITEGIVALVIALAALARFIWWARTISPHIRDNA